MTRINLAVVLLASMLTAATTAAFAQAGGNHNETARYLAGLPAAGAAGAELNRDRLWQQHAQHFNSAWNKLDKEQLSKVRAWSAEHIKAPPRPLFYTFSGPDFVYADSFFPEATTYVMVGLEPVGPIPVVSDRTRYALGGLRSSLNTILNISFFITSDMGDRLHQGALKGTLPILLTFLARADRTIHEVSLIDLDAEGAAHEVERHVAARRGAHRDPGAKIVFSRNGGAKQTLYYFRTDLSDGGTKASGFLKFCEKLGSGDALIKSASYLLHAGHFSLVRKFLINKAQILVQDDTGVPVHLLKPEDWDLKPFGAYLGPIDIFPGRYQPQLAQLFRKNKPPKLDFGIGYRWRGHDSNLLLAIKKNTVAQRP